MIAGNSKQIGDRLRGERSRLGLSQVAFADACAVNRGTLATWEKGEQTPTAVVLSVMADLGVDVLYIVTGERLPKGAESLSIQEAALVDSYARADEAGRTALQAVAAIACRSSAPVATRSGPTINIGGDVGQSVSGDQVIHGAVHIGAVKKR